MVIIVPYVLLSVLVGYYASSKGRSLIGFLLAVLFKGDPSAAEAKAVAAGTRKKCPYCAELIKAEATVCRFCGRNLPAADTVG